MFSHLSHPRLSVYQYISAWKCRNITYIPSFNHYYDDLLLYSILLDQVTLVNATIRFSRLWSFDAAMLDLSVFFRYWLFASAFTTIYIILDSLLGSVHGFMQVYYNWSECIAFTEDILYIGPTLRSIATAILALLFLKVQQACLSILWPRSWSPRSCVAKIVCLFAVLIF